MNEREHQRLSKDGDKFCRELAKIAAGIMKNYREEVWEEVRVHLQDCTSLYSPYTADRIDEILRTRRT